MNVWSGEIHSRVRACWKLFKIFSKVLCDIILAFLCKDSRLDGQRRAFSGQKARQCVPQCILGGVAVLFTVRKHACASEATPRLNFCL